MIQAVCFITLLVVASVFDIKKRIIPDSLNLAIAMAALLSFTPIHLLGIFTAVPFLIAAMYCGGMGGGDIKFMGACGLVLGLSGGIFATIIGLMVFLIYTITYNAVRKLRGEKAVNAFPLAPFLGVGCLLIYIIQL